jgi:raffinose/stachyose/melibiose transport system substrate-binding protein
MQQSFDFKGANKMLKLQKTIVMLLMSVLIIGGCSTGKDNGSATEQPTGKPSTSAVANGEPLEITIYGSWSTEQEKGKTLKDLLDEYSAASDGKVNVKLDINSEWSMYVEKVKTMIAANQTPDLFAFNYNPNDLSRQKSGKLIDFLLYMDEEWKARFSQAELDAMTVDGKLNSIPFERSGLLFYYNKELFAKAGIERFPETWDEFFAAAEKLKAINVAPISLMTAGDAWHTANAFSYLVGSAGGPDSIKTGESLNTPEMVKAAEQLRKLFDYTTTDALGADYSVSANHFLLGDTAMIVDGPWMSGSIEADMQDKIGIAGGPTFGDGVMSPGFIVTDALTPWAGGIQESKEKEQAIVDLMKFLTSPESSKRLFIEGGVSLSAKVELTEEDKSKISPVLSTFTDVTGNANESLVQIARVITPGASAEFSSLLEGLVMDQLTPEQFVQRLDEANK